MEIVPKTLMQLARRAQDCMILGSNCLVLYQHVPYEKIHQHHRSLESLSVISRADGTGTEWRHTPQSHEAIANIRKIGDVQHCDAVVVVPLIVARIVGKLMDRVDPASLIVVGRADSETSRDERESTNFFLNVHVRQWLSRRRPLFLEEGNCELQLTLESSLIAGIREDAEQSEARAQGREAVKPLVMDRCERAVMFANSRNHEELMSLAHLERRRDSA